MTAEFAVERRFRAWIALVLLLVPALPLLAWSGSSWDPRFCVPWTWSKSGWLLPAPGLGWVWFSSALLVWILSEIAWRLFEPVAGAKTLKPWASAGIILLLAVGTRAAIVRSWTPLSLDAASLAAKTLVMAGRWMPLAADLLLIGLLMLALAGARRSLWWAAIYALHPLPLIEIAGNGHWIAAAVLPLVFVAAVGHRFSRAIRLGLASAVALAGVAAIVALGDGSGFNSLSLELLRTAGLGAELVLPLAAAMLQAVVLVVGHRRDWALPRTLAHLLLVFLMCSPVVQPWYVVALLALAPLAWTRAGWVLSAVVLGAYMVVPIVGMRGRFQVPDWWLMLEWVPVMVLEAQELLAEGRMLFRRRAFAGHPSPVT